MHLYVSRIRVLAVVTILEFVLRVPASRTRVDDGQKIETSQRSKALERVGLFYDGELQRMPSGVRAVMEELPDIPEGQFYEQDTYHKIAEAAANDHTQDIKVPASRAQGVLGAAVVFHGTPKTDGVLRDSAQAVLQSGPPCKLPCVTVINMVEPGSDRGAMMAVRNMKTSGPWGEHVRAMGYMLRDRLEDYDPSKPESPHNKLDADVRDMIVEFNMEHLRKGHDQRIADSANVGMADLIIAFKSDRNMGGRGPGENANFGMFGVFGSLQARLEDHVIGGPIHHCVRYNGVEGFGAEDLKQMVSPYITIFNKGESYNGYDWKPVSYLPKKDYPARELRSRWNRFDGTPNRLKYLQHSNTHPMKSNKDAIILFLTGDSQRPMETFSPKPSVDEWARVIADRMENITQERGIQTFNLMTAGIMDSATKGGITESTTEVIQAAVTLYLEKRTGRTGKDKAKDDNSGAHRSARGQPSIAGILLIASALFSAAQRHVRS